jgi:hypothetical protein
MSAVIFRARAGSQDDEYAKTVKMIRQLAFSKYGCIDFAAVKEGGSGNCHFSLARRGIDTALEGRW